MFYDERQTERKTVDNFGAVVDMTAIRCAGVMDHTELPEADFVIRDHRELPGILEELDWEAGCPAG